MSWLKSLAHLNVSRIVVTLDTSQPPMSWLKASAKRNIWLTSVADDESPAQLRRRDAYQSLVGSIGWLANCTRPDVAPAHSFLSSYLMRPALGHMKAALYVLHYIHSTHDYGITFTSRICRPVHTYVHHPHSSDTEAYGDAVPPTKEQHHRFTTYSDA